MPESIQTSATPINKQTNFCLDAQLAPRRALARIFPSPGAANLPSLQRSRAINALTALLRTIDLGIDTRKALSHSRFKVIAAWRDRRESSVVRTCRQEVGFAPKRRSPHWRVLVRYQLRLETPCGTDSIAAEIDDSTEP